MYLTNYQRALKLSRNLLLNPQFLFLYFRYSITSRSPLEVELPWWSWKAIEALKRHLTSKHKVFEWGSGGSTIFLAKKANHVTSVEQHPDWLNKLKSEISGRGLENVTLLDRELDASSQKAFENCPYANALDSIQDVIVVDGQDHFGPHTKWSARESCFRIAEKWIKSPGGIIIVDDSWRYSSIRTNTKAKKLVIHESVGPCRKGVTSTDFHYY